MDVSVEKRLPDNPTDDENFHASLFLAVISLHSKLGKYLLNTNTYNVLQWSLLDTSHESGLQSNQDICECTFENLNKERLIIAGIVSGMISVSGGAWICSSSPHT